MKLFRLPRFLRTLGLPAVTLLAPLSAWADTTISSDFTQNGGTFAVDAPVLLVTHESNDPTLTFTNGATAQVSGLQAAIIGNLTGESGNLEILGGSSLLTNGSSDSFVGTYGSEGVSRQNVYIGLNAGSSGSVLVSGSGSKWTNSAWFGVGWSGAGELRIQEGGSVSNTFGSIGRNDGADGRVTVTDAGSTWTSGQLFVERGELKIENGGSVSSVFASIFTYSEGLVTVTGESSLWTNTGNLTLESLGDGMADLSIENGGTVWIGGTLGISSGDTVTLDGGTIRFNGYNRNAAGTFDYQSGTVQLAGNRVAETDAAIADLYGANPVVGAGKVLVIEGSLSVGNSDAVILTIEDGGIVAVEGGTGVYGEGTLLIRENGVLETSVLISHGEVVIEGGGAVTAGVGTQVYGGTFHIAGGGTLETQTLISGGELLVSGNLFAENGVSVESGGVIGGGGQIEGDLSLLSGAKFTFSLTDTLTVSGGVSIDSTFGIADLLGLDNTIALGTYILIDGTATDFSTLGLQNWGEENAYDLGNGKSAYFSQGSLQVTVVPEPATCLLTGLGLATLLLRRGRRNARSVSGTINP